MIAWAGCGRAHSIPPAVAVLGLTVSDPPTQAEVQQIAAKLDELIAALQRILRQAETDAATDTRPPLSTPQAR